MQSKPSRTSQNAGALSGIKFTFFKANKRVSINLEEFGPEVCVSDFNRDGWRDIYFLNGGIVTSAASPSRTHCIETTVMAS